MTSYAICKFMLACSVSYTGTTDITKLGHTKNDHTFVSANWLDFLSIIRNTQTPGTPTLLVLFTAVMVGSPEDGISHGVLPFTPVYVTCGLIRGLIQVNEKSFDLKEGWYKEEGDKTGMNGCMLPW